MVRPLLLPVLASALLLACGGSVERVPDANANASATPTPGGGGSSSGSIGGSSSGGGACQALPRCDEGDTEFQSQEKACIEITGASCYDRSLCGTTIWCQHADVQCDGYPECNPGEHQVKACVPDSVCKTYASCGVTIICQKDDPPCEGPQPICDPGDTQVSGPNACWEDDATCYSRSTCGFTIWCTGPA